MPQSTPLDQLGGSAHAPSEPSVPTSVPPADEERVRRIMAEIGAEATVQQPPALHETPRVITEPPLSTSTGQIRMDPGTARAHVIGNSIPTMADFQMMLAQSPPGMAPYNPPLPTPGPVITKVAPTTSWKDSVVQNLRGPIAVAIIVFFLNLPVITNILSRYAAWMYLSSGEISVPGLLVKALLAAILFAAYQGVAGIFDSSR